jgi:Putative zinc-finger
MSLGHFLHRRKVSLLALGALEGRERRAVERHAASCEPCARELASFVALREELRDDPVRSAEPELPLGILVARVEARLDESGKRPRALAAGPLGWSAAAVALLAVVVWSSAGRWPLVPETVPSAARDETPAVSAEALDRLDRNVAREQTARYLNEAGDVLVSMAAEPENCDRKDERVDVGQAPERSRELLARRALLPDEPQAVASVRPVLDEVEQALREVAALDACVRRRDVERLQEDVERRRLLMRIRLMTRELEG